MVDNDTKVTFQSIFMLFDKLIAQKSKIDIRSRDNQGECESVRSNYS